MGGPVRDQIRIYNTCAGYHYVRRQGVAGGAFSASWGMGEAEGPYEDLVKWQLEDRAGEPGIAMVQRRHPVEQVGRVTRAGVDAGHGLLVGRARVAEGHPHAASRERADQVERVRQFRREGDDAGAACGGENGANDIAAAEIGFIIGRCWSGR